MLIFFHLYWLDIKQDITDHSQYLNKISALLNIYINMELKISMEEKCNNAENSSETAVKILTALYVYLNNSEEHIFRVLLRIKYTTEEYTKVCNHIFMKSFTNLKTKMISITDIAYIRYLLAFKMWKDMILSEEKKNNLILALLGPRMPELQDKLSEFVPRPPMGEKNETLWLIKSNLFNEKVRQEFLLFEDKMDNSTCLQHPKTFFIDQNCSKSQTSPLFQQSNSNGATSEQKIKKCLDGLQNNNTLSNNENKSLDQTCLQKKGSKSLKSLKKVRRKRGKPIIIGEIIDLTGDDEISPPCKMKRKRLRRNSECLKIMKKIMKSKKHINFSKYSRKPINTNVKELSNNEENKVLGENIRLECKPIYDIKINDSTENCTSVICSNCTSIFVDQNIKGFKVTAKENKLENCVSLYVTIGNAISSYNNSLTQNKETVTSQEESAMETIPLFKMCQNNIADQHSFKQELPTSTNCNTMQQLHKCCNIMPVDVHDITHTIKISKSINDHNSSQITEIITQKICHQINECPNCTKIDCKPLIFANNDITTTAKTQGTLRIMTEQDKSNDTCTVSTTFTEDQIGDLPLYDQHVNDLKNFSKTEEADRHNADENNIETFYDTNMLSDRDKCIYLTNDIGEDITSAEKGIKCLKSSNDTCTVSTTFTGDQIAELSLDSQYVNSDNKRKRDENISKYFDNVMEKQERSNCDTSISNKQLHSSELHFFDSFEIDSKEANEIMKNINDSENISFLHNQTETLENILSNDTTNFPLSLLEDIYAETSLSENVLCNNQNDPIDSSIDLVSFHLNADNFLQLPIKSDKSMFQGSMKFRYSS